MCMSLWVCEHECSCPQSASDSLVLHFQVVLSYMTTMLGIELGFLDQSMFLTTGPSLQIHTKLGR